MNNEYNFMNKSNSFESLKCIWMASNIIEYKLCDRSFDCDSCIFDKAIRNTFHKANMEDIQEIKSMNHNIIQDVINKIGNCEFKNNYMYFNNHLIAKNLFDDTYYLGFNPIASNLLDNIKFIDSCSEKNIVSIGDKIISVKGGWGEITVTSPLNFMWLGKLSNIEESFANEKWFGLVEINKKELENSTVSVSNYHKEIINITKKLNSCALEYPDVGMTMLDGGQEIVSLYQSIGKQKYLEILENLFKTKFKIMKS